MSNALKQALGAKSFGLRAPDIGSTPMLFGSARGAGLGLGTSPSNTLTHHNEQYRHYAGWVYASIRPIAQSVARQAVRVARVPKRRNARTAPMTAKSHIFTSQGPVSKDRAAQELWLRRTLPGALKSHAETAEILEWHPILDIINKPNPIMARWALFLTTVASIDLTGKAYWWIKQGDEDGEPLQIWPMPSHWVAPVHTKQKLFESWDIRPDGASKPINVPRKQVVCFYTPDPANPFNAYATLQAQARAVISDEAIAEAQRQSFQRGIFPGLAVVMGRLPDAMGNAGAGERPLLTNDQRQQITIGIKQMFQGVYNYDEPLILDQLIQDIKRITQSPREMDFMQSGLATKEKITQAFGTNPIVMGQVENASRNSAATAQQIFYDLAVNPKIALMSEFLSMWFSPEFSTPDEELLLYIEEARSSDPDSDREDYRLLKDHFAIDRNEMRAGLRGLPPIDSGEMIAVPAGLTWMDIADVQDTNMAPMLLDAEAAPVASEDPKPTDEEKPKENQQQDEQVPDAGAAALNGAQIASLLLVIKKITSGELTREVAMAILGASFPTMDEAVLAKIIEGVVVKPPAPTVDEVRSVVAQALQAREDEELTDRIGTKAPVPNIAQNEAYDCGAAAARAVAEHYEMVHEWTSQDFVMALNTSDEAGTEPRHIVDLFKHNGCDVQYGKHWTLGRLFDSLRRGVPVVCCIQGLTFGDDDDRAKQQNGHWVVVDGAADNRIFYMDPSTGAHEQADWQTWKDNWKDRGVDGTPYERYGIAVGPPPKPVVDEQSNTMNARACVLRLKSHGYYCRAKSLGLADRIAEIKGFFKAQHQTIYTALMTYYRRQRAAIEAKLDDWSKSVSFDGIAPMTGDLLATWPYDGQKATDQEDSAMQLVDSLLPLHATTARLVGAVRDAILQVALNAAGKEYSDLEPMADEEKAKRKPKVDRTPLPKPIREVCHDYLGRVVAEPYWEDMTYRVRLQMARSIRRGLAHGEDRAAIALRVLAVVSEGNDAVRADLIATTEANGAYNLGQHATRAHLIAQGANITKLWQVVEDGRERASHDEANGQEVKHKNKFRVGKEWCLYPGAQNLSPGERCRCRCTAISIPH
jgi:phage portal protein BeeE